MTTKKLSILSLISISAVGLFIFFLNIFSSQVQPSSTTGLKNTTTNNNQNTQKSTDAITPLVSTNTTTQATSSTPTAITSTTAESAATPPAASTQPQTYKDGTYTASASYRVPHATESISVSVSLKGDIVTNFSVNNSANNGESAAYQSSFEGEIQGQVASKKLQDLDLSAVGGASLTTNAFMQAINKVGLQAKA